MKFLRNGLLEFINTIHQYLVWPGNDACPFAILILSIMVDLTDMLTDTIYHILSHGDCVCSDDDDDDDANNDACNKVVSSLHRANVFKK